MKFRRIQFPGKTLVLSSLDSRYDVFALYFLRFWSDKFGEKADFSGVADSILSAYAYPVTIPQGFFKRIFFLFQYKTVVFLNPDAAADRLLKWLVRLVFVRHRAGFAPPRGINPLNYSLPFNTENHHYVHQLKIFFEYLSGEKITEWQKPEIPPGRTTSRPRPLPRESYGVLAIDLGEDTTAYLLNALQKFINLAARQLHLVLIVDDTRIQRGQATAFSRRLSETMTQRAVEVTELVQNPADSERLRIVREAIWVAGTDAAALNLAALEGIPSLSIFGPLNERIWQPFATRARALTGDFACRPCTKFPGKVDCKNAVPWQCISGVTGELMLATLNGMSHKLLQGRRPR